MSAFTEREGERGVTEAGRRATQSAEATVTLRRMPLLSGLQKLRWQRTGLLVCRNPGNTAKMWLLILISCSNLENDSRCSPGKPHQEAVSGPWLLLDGSAFQILCKWCLGHNSYWSRAGRGPQEVGSPGFSPRMRSTANSTEDKLAQDCFPVSLLTWAQKD